VILYALAVRLLIYRDFKPGALPQVLAATGRSTALILFLLAAAGPFSWLVAESQIKHAIGGLLGSISTNPAIVPNLMIGLLHPPIGPLLFIVSSVGRVPLGAVMRVSLPFLAWSIVVPALAIVFPPVTTWLPSQVR